MANYFNNQGNVVVAGTIGRNVTHINYVHPTPEQEPLCFGYEKPVADFVGRRTELELLKKDTVECEHGKSAIVVVSGLGGIGKTQLVKKFIEENRKFYHNVICINSQEYGSIEAEFKKLAVNFLNISAVNVNRQEKDFNSLAQEVFTKLTKSSTLIVFDNVDRNENTTVVLQMGTLGVAPHIVITSRLQEWGDSIKLIKLDLFSMEDALEYVSHKLNNSEQNDSLEDKRKLVNTLQNFPIALRQATSHIRYRRKQENFEIIDYINEYNSRREQILNSRFFQEDVLNKYTETTLTTWEITMNAIEKCGADGNIALSILRIIAYFDPVRILREIFFNLKHSTNGQNLNQSEVKSAVGLLINYSMVDSYERQSVLSIHKLVQHVIQIQLEKVRCVEEATLREALQLISDMNESEKLHNCWNEHGESVLNDVGKYLRAETFGTQILPSLTTILGEEHPDTLIAKSKCAKSFSNLGKYSEALELFVEALDKGKIILGESHPNTLFIKFSIGIVYRNIGKYSEAIEMFEEVMEKQKLIVEVDHPDILTLKYAMAESYNDSGKHSEALEMFEEVLEKRETSLGVDHPDTLNTKYNMASLYINLGNYSGALEVFEEVFEKQKVVLGENHPNTLATKYEIANSKINLGAYSDALVIFEEVQEKEKSILGTDHPNTLNSRSKIANCYSSLGKYAEALEMFEEIFEKQKFVLGENHRNTLFTQSEIAKLYGYLGNYSDALRVFEEVLEKQQSTLGDNHPNTLFTKSEIANSYNNLGKYPEGLEILGEVLDKRKSILGVDHPDTVVTQYNIADLYHKCGKYSVALQMFEEVLDKVSVTFGESHDHTFFTRCNIANLYNNLGKYSEAFEMFEKVYQQCKTNFGDDHPDTLTIRSI